MGSMTIRQIDDDMKDWLRKRAAETGRSMESEVRHILRRNMAQEMGGGYPGDLAVRPGENWVEYLIRISRPGFDLELPERRVEDRASPFK